jgi:hypothetical protein
VLTQPSATVRQVSSSLSCNATRQFPTKLQASSKIFEFYFSEVFLSINKNKLSSANSLNAKQINKIEAKRLLSRGKQREVWFASRILSRLLSLNPKFDSNHFWGSNQKFGSKATTGHLPLGPFCSCRWPFVVEK